METDQNLHQLTQVMRLLAASAAEQLAAFPEYVVVADELALLLQDVLLTFDACSESGDSDLLRVARAIDQLLESMSGPQNAQLWTASAMREKQQWEQIREMAQAALPETDRLPILLPGWVKFVRGAAPHDT